MDVALIFTNPTIIATGIILIPATIFLALILSGNKVLSLVDLPSLIFILPMMGAFFHKNMFRMIISGTLIITCIIYFGTDISGIYIEAAQMSHVTLANGINETIKTYPNRFYSR
ncbi:TPA_asm: hypothetical protein G0E33_10035 [Salmonella enterica]|nr:hypothetical protein [Salmonella enterica]